MSTPILPFAVWASGTNQNSIPANDNSLRNQILNGLVISESTTSQPVSPADGDIYIIPAAATGTQWATFDEFDLAIYSGGTWYAFAPAEGIVVNVSGILKQWDGDSYETVGGGGGGMTNPMTTDGDIITGGASGAPLRLAAGTNGQVLTIVSGAPAWGAATGLTNWTTGVNSAAPNTTVPVVSITVNNAATNVDAVLGAKGNGASLAVVPDGSAGGNKRGQYATDWQKSIASQTQVASGNYSAIPGGQTNTASGTHSFAMGQSCVASGNHSVSLGSTNNVSGNRGFAAGEGHTVDGARAAALGGLGANTRGISGAVAQGSSFSSAAQRMTMVMYFNTTDATPSVMSADGTAAAASNQLTLPNNADYLVEGTVVARQNTTGDSKSWRFVAHIKRGANAAATAMVAASTPTVVAAAAGASAWTIAVDANTTLGCLRITVTGEASKNIKWVASILDCAQLVG